MLNLFSDPYHRTPGRFSWRPPHSWWVACPRCFSVKKASEQRKLNLNFRLKVENNTIVFPVHNGGLCDCTFYNWGPWLCIFRQEKAWYEASVASTMYSYLTRVNERKLINQIPAMRNDCCVFQTHLQRIYLSMRYVSSTCLFPNCFVSLSAKLVPCRPDSRASISGNNKVSVARKVGVPAYTPLGGDKFISGISVSENKLYFLFLWIYSFVTYISTTRGKANSSSSRNPGGRNRRTLAGIGEFGSWIDNSLIFGMEHLLIIFCSFSLFSSLKTSVSFFRSIIREKGIPGPRHSCMNISLFGDIWTLLYKHWGPGRSHVMQEKARLALFELVFHKCSEPGSSSWFAVKYLKHECILRRRFTFLLHNVFILIPGY